jgi:hypothetical protein
MLCSFSARAHQEEVVRYVNLSMTDPLNSDDDARRRSWTEELRKLVRFEEPGPGRVLLGQMRIQGYRLVARFTIRLPR